MKQKLGRLRVPERISIFQGKDVSYVETTHPNDSVECDVYVFDNDASSDLAIIQVAAFGKTPKQKVLLGERTREGYISGSGELMINDGPREFPGQFIDEVDVRIGDTMQWCAGRKGLVFYEICTPPYSDGRFKEIL